MANDQLLRLRCGQIRRRSFCNRYGLLGILPQQAVQMRFIPFGLDVGLGKEDWDYTQTEYTRLNGSWVSREHQLEFDGDEWEGDLPAETFHYPFLDNVFRGNACVTPTSDIRQRYKITEGYVPLSKDWWRTYREPLSDFLLFARVWARTIRRRDEFEINNILSSGGQYLRVKPEPHFFPVYPSLLAIFTRMVAEDLCPDRRIFNCAGCGKPSVTDRPQTLYCSETCASRVQKRRQRQKGRGPGRVPRSLFPDHATRRFLSWTSAHPRKCLTGIESVKRRFKLCRTVSRCLF